MNTGMGIFYRVIDSPSASNLGAIGELQRIGYGSTFVLTYRDKYGKDTTTAFGSEQVKEIPMMLG